MTSWEHTRGLLAMFMCGFRRNKYLTDDNAVFDAAIAGLEDATKPGAPLAHLRTAQVPVEVEWQQRTRVQYAWRPATEAEALHMYRIQPNLVRCITVVERVPKG